MTSKAARLRRKGKKRATTTLPGGEAAPAVKGSDRRKPREDPRREALEARLRVAGIPTTPEAMKAAVAPSYGDDVGRCINAMVTGDDADEDAAEMWRVFTEIQKARRAWLQRHIGKTGDPQNSAIAMVPDEMQTDPSLTVDIRTPEERDIAAKRAEAYWRARLDRITMPAYRMALRSAADGFGGPWWRDGKPTPGGRHVVEGLRIVVKGEGK